MCLDASLSDSLGHGLEWYLPKKKHSCDEGFLDVEADDDALFTATCGAVSASSPSVRPRKFRHLEQCKIRELYKCDVFSHGSETE